MSRPSLFRAARIVGLLLIAAALVPGMASATVPGHWDPVTAANGANIDQVATVRTPDGRLHVLWHEPTGANASLVQTVLAANGKVGPAQTIEAGWAGIGDAVILRTTGGQLLVFAPATRSADATDPFQSAEQWSSSDSGATWSISPAAVIQGAGFSDPLGGAIGPDGMTAFLAWGTTDGLWLHRMGDPPGTNLNLQNAAGFGCCGYDPAVALDGATGRIVVAWYALVNQGNALYARTVDASTNTPIGTTMRMPGTLNSVSPLQRVGLTGRLAKAGVFAAYNGGGASQTTVLVWRVGGAGATTLAVDHNHELGVPAITSTPDGRLWVAWASSGRIWARRSNLAATQWGAVTSIPVVHGTDTTYKLALNATNGVLDVFGAFQPQGGSGVRTWHSQMLAGLTLTASPASLKLAKGKSGKVKLTVTDAGVAVKGAHVSIGGHTASTNNAGSATINVGPFKHSTSLKASASATGYVSATQQVKVTVH